MKTLLDLYLSFFRIGALTFGGGYAMMPMLEKETVKRYGWVSKEQLLDFYALGQCMPGVIAVNTAAFVGNTVCSIPGSIAAALGVVSPSLILMIVIGSVLQNIWEIEIVMHAFAGIRAAVAALIASVVLNLWKSAVVDRPTLVLFGASFALCLFTDISPILFILGSSGCGYALWLMRKRRENV